MKIISKDEIKKPNKYQNLLKAIVISFIIFFIPKGNAKEFSPSNTAIILIDLWNEKFLDDYVVNSINPFLSDVSKKGYLLINAPSQNPKHRNLVDKFDYTLFDWDPVFPILKKHNIENIIYIGFDKLLCLIDKPAGAFHLKSLGFDYKMFILDDLSVSVRKEMDELAQHFFKELDIKKVTSNEIIDKEYNSPYEYHRNTKFSISISKLKGDKPIIVLFNKESGQLKEIVDDLNIPIIEVTNGISKLNSYSFIKYLKEKKITDIIWGGYYADSDILFNQLGLLNVYIKQRYYDDENIRFNDLPKFFLLDELFFIKNEILSKKDTKAVLGNHYRQINFINLENLKPKNNLSIIHLKIELKHFFAKHIVNFLGITFLLVFLVIITFLGFRKIRR